MDTPCHVRGLGALGRPRFGRGRLRHLGGRLLAVPVPIDDRVAGNRVEPRRTRAALGSVGLRGTPDGREGFLHRILRAHPVAEATERETENRPRVAVIEKLEGLGVPPRHAANEVAVGQTALLQPSLRGRFPATATGHSSRQGDAHDQAWLRTSISGSRRPGDRFRRGGFQTRPHSMTRASRFRPGAAHENGECETKA